MLTKELKITLSRLMKKRCRREGNFNSFGDDLIPNYTTTGCRRTLTLAVKSDTLVLYF